MVDFLAKTHLLWTIDYGFKFALKVLGGFVSSVVLYLLYIDMPKDEITAGIFATYPRPGVSLLQGGFIVNKLLILVEKVTNLK